MAISYDRDVAADIYAVGQKMGVSDDVMLAGLAAALVESNMSNVDYGDRDSLGVFQQRPSQGWGTPAQVQRPRYAARQFFQAAQGVDDYSNVGDLAQQVQRSAYPERYQQRLDDAQRILSRLQGGQGGGGATTQVQAAGGGFTPVVEDEDDTPLLSTLLQSMSQKMRGAADPTETPEQRQVRGTFGDVVAAPTGQASAEGDNPDTVLDDPGVDAMHAAGDTATGTRARSDPNFSPMAWGGYDNGKIPESELKKVDGNLLAPDAARAWRRMKRDAAADGIDLSITDGYRSYAEQVAVREEKGDQVATATPGTSIHGWGKAIDAGPEGREWIQQNGAKYGWIWPEWAQDSGFSYEPWHFEFNGSA